LFSVPARLPLWQIRTGIGERTVQVHNPRYYFNGDALAIGVVLGDAGGAAAAGVRLATAELTSC
jgi:hypothetical protein